MPMRLEGSCRCGAVKFAVDSRTPYPYQRCYCSICRKSAGGGGYAINIMGMADTLKVTGGRAIRVWHATIDGREGSAERHFCRQCGTALWVSDRSWPELMHPFANAIDTPLPVPPKNVHLLLRDKAEWVVPQIGPDDECYDGYPELSIEDWHKTNGLWID
ncbi:MAG TPA: GFA family protein [Stellaceae bacterium]